MRYGLILLVLFTGLSGISQRIHTAYFHLDKLTIKNRVVADSAGGFERYKNKAEEQFRLNGYTGVSLTDSTVKGNAIHYQYSFENRFNKIRLINLSDSAESEKKSYARKNYTAILSDINHQLEELENTGYPFARLSIVKAEESGNTLKFFYTLDSGDFFIVDRIYIKTNTPIHEGTFLNIAGIEPGDVYNESQISRIEDLLNISGLYRLIRPAELVFHQGKADLYLYPEKKKASDADGFVGFQQDKNSNKIVLNGYLNLSLQNAFNRAETISLNWKNNPQSTQNLKMKFEYPYLLKTPLGIGANLNLQKQDTSFVRADAIFDLSYLQARSRFGVYYQLESSTTLLQNIPSDLRDYKKNTVGLNLRYTPESPVALQFFHPGIALSGGFFFYRGDSVDVNSNDGSNAKYMIRYFHVIDFLRYFHLNNSIQFEGLKSSGTLSRNELVFFGGLRSIRGFYELELTGNDVTIYNNEIEFTPVNSISFKLLYDYATYNRSGYHQLQAAGFGFGFSTGSIKLEIVVADGWAQGTTPALSNTKIHLGFKSVF